MLLRHNPDFVLSKLEKIGVYLLYEQNYDIESTESLIF